MRRRRNITSPLRHIVLFSAMDNIITTCLLKAVSPMVRYVGFTSCFELERDQVHLKINLPNPGSTTTAAASRSHLFHSRRLQIRRRGGRGPTGAGGQESRASEQAFLLSHLAVAVLWIAVCRLAFRCGLEGPPLHRRAQDAARTSSRQPRRPDGRARASFQPRTPDRHTDGRMNNAS